MTEPTLRDCTDPALWWPHIDEAVRTLARGALAVIPTDTVYGIAADAFTPAAVQALLDAKGRDRQMPPPVLIGDVRTLDGLAVDVSQEVRDLVEAFWPGPLTIIVNAQPSLMWDLGETEGTVALRMPDNELTLTLLRRTGPLAVSSANKSGRRAARTARDAARQLGNAVSLYLDNGRTRGAVPSTIVDATGPELRIVREGALRPAKLGTVVPSLGPQPEPEPEAEPVAEELADAPEADGLEPAPEAGEAEDAPEADGGKSAPEAGEAEVVSQGDGLEPAPEAGEAEVASEADGGESAPEAGEAEVVSEGDGLEPAPEAGEAEVASEADGGESAPEAAEAASEKVASESAQETGLAEAEPESDAVVQTPQTDQAPEVGEATLEFDPESEAEPVAETSPIGPERNQPASAEGPGAADQGVEDAGTEAHGAADQDTTESHAGESTAP